MSGVFLVEVAKIDQKEKVVSILNELGYEHCQEYKIEQFHDNGEGEECVYQVFLISIGKEQYILKKSSNEEKDIYTKFLENHAFAVPHFINSCRDKDGEEWILIEYVKGKDLREFNQEIAVAAAESIIDIHNYYWKENEIEEERFKKYWKRINKRAECLKKELDLKRAYDVFLERQLTCPRTLCNGDFLQYNAIYKDKRVIVIDWAFGGIMPYSLDISRILVHGNEHRYPFPFYMIDEYRKLFVKTYYNHLKDKMEYKSFIWDIVLSGLNECIEFIESELNDPTMERDKGFDFYYNTAKNIASIINRGYEKFNMI